MTMTKTMDLGFGCAPRAAVGTNFKLMESVT